LCCWDYAKIHPRTDEDILSGVGLAVLPTLGIAHPYKDKIVSGDPFLCNANNFDLTMIRSRSIGHQFVISHLLQNDPRLGTHPDCS